MMLKQEQIQKFAVSLPQAPPIFREEEVMSFFGGGTKTEQSRHDICAGASAFFKHGFLFFK